MMETTWSLPPSLLIALGVSVVVALMVAVYVSLIQLKRQNRPSAQAAYTRGLTALIAGNRRDALKWLKEAVQEDSNNLDAYMRLGDLLRESGEARKALAVHRDLTVRPSVSNEDQVRILGSMIRDYLALDRYEEAGQAADRLRRLDKKNPLALGALRQVAEALEDWPRAIEAQDAFTVGRLGDKDAKEEQARYRTFVARQEFSNGKLDVAEKHLHSALKLDPECADVYELLGDIKESQGKIEEALEHWRREVLNHPQGASRVFERLERAFFETGRFGEIPSFYRELLERIPKEEAGPALLALAEIHRRKGELEDAQFFVEDALEINPHSTKAHRHAIKIAVDRNDPEEALQRIDQMLGATGESLPSSPTPPGE